MTEPSAGEASIAAPGERHPADVLRPPAEASEQLRYLKPVPEPTAVTKPFWDAAREHKLVIQRSKKTGRYVFYPRQVSPFGACDELEWVEVSGRATVYSYTVARRPTAPQWVDDGAYVIAIVELEEGPHLTANVLGCSPEDVRVGMPVVAAFVDVTPEVTLVQFRPA